MTPTIRHVAKHETKERISQILSEDGGVIVDDALSVLEADAILAELGSFIESTAPIGDDFAGHQTTRTGGLVAKSRTVRDLVLSPFLLGMAQTFLEPYTEKIQLNLTQVIRLLPGESAQVLHRDRFIWSQSLPREIEPQFNSIWALTDFTEENGATQVVPGSHRWDWDRHATKDEITQAVMGRGSVLLYTGSVIHGGGANHSNGDRIALNITYSNAWLRQEENQYLSCPPEIAKDYSRELQSLLGYTMANYALGYFSPTKFIPNVPDTIAPEMLFSEEGGDVREFFGKAKSF